MSGTGAIRIRGAGESDLDVVAGFEARIAEVSFPDDPIIDLDVHKKKLAKALARDEAGMFVAEHESRREVVGWLWVSLNQNFATGARYAHFRSLFVSPGPDSSGIAEQLFQHGLDYVRDSGVKEVIGKVHVDNVPMRLVYRKFDFEPEHLTMRRQLAPTRATRPDRGSVNARADRSAEAGASEKDAEMT